MLTDTSYAALARAAGLNVYFIAEGDRDGAVRVEECVPANPCCNCYSIAKLFTVTALGILYDRGLLSPETRLTDILPLRPADERLGSVTLDQLLTHRAGLGITLDIDCEDASSFPRDYARLIFDTPLAYAPGTARKYTDAAFYLLARAAKALCGEDPAGLLRAPLMDVMRFSEFAWSVCPLGCCMGATGLYLRTADMVKLGILYLRGGDWFGTRIVSEEWVDLVFRRGYELAPLGNGWFGKGGMHGQMLAISPQRALAAAWHGYGAHGARKVFLGI